MVLLESEIVGGIAGGCGTKPPARPRKITRTSTGLTRVDSVTFTGTPVPVTGFNFDANASAFFVNQYYGGGLISTATVGWQAAYP